MAGYRLAQTLIGIYEGDKSVFVSHQNKNAGDESGSGEKDEEDKKVAGKVKPNLAKDLKKDEKKPAAKDKELSPQGKKKTAKDEKVGAKVAANK